MSSHDGEDTHSASRLQSRTRHSYTQAPRSSSSMNRFVTGMAALVDSFLIVDFEATCDHQHNLPINPKEIIEFAAVLVDAATGDVLSEFRTYVRPRYHPILTQFCMDLTGIQQEQVTNGVPLGTALAMHDEWLQQVRGARSFAVVAWGDWHCRTMLQSECWFKGLDRPAYFNEWVDLRVHFPRPHGGRMDLQEAIMHAGLQWEGHLHRGLDDARNVARLVRYLVQQGRAAIAVTGQLAPAPEEQPQAVANGPLCLCGVPSMGDVIRGGQRFHMCGNWTLQGGAVCRFYIWL